MSLTRQNLENTAPVMQQTTPAIDAGQSSTTLSRKISMTRRLYKYLGTRCLHETKVEFAVPIELSTLVNSALADLYEKYKSTGYAFLKSKFLIPTGRKINEKILYDSHDVQDERSWKAVSRLILNQPDQGGEPLRIIADIEFRTIGKRKEAATVPGSQEPQVRPPTTAVEAPNAIPHAQIPNEGTACPSTTPLANSIGESAAKPPRMINFERQLYLEEQCTSITTLQLALPLEISSLVKNAQACLSVPNDTYLYPFHEMEIDIPTLIPGEFTTRRLTEDLAQGQDPHCLWEEVNRDILAVPAREDEPLKVPCRMYFDVEEKKWVEELQQRWMCLDRGCVNDTWRPCWVDDDIHYGIEPDSQCAWSEAIEQGRANLDDPPYSVAKMLRKNSVPRVYAIPTSKHALEQTDCNAGPPTKRLARTPVPPRKSMPRGHVGDIRHFFSWLKYRDPTREHQLDMCCEKFVADLYTLEGVKHYAEQDRNNHLAVPLGLLVRPRAEVRAYDTEQYKERTASKQVMPRV